MTFFRMKKSPLDEQKPYAVIRVTRKIKNGKSSRQRLRKTEMISGEARWPLSNRSMRPCEFADPKWSSSINFGSVIQNNTFHTSFLCKKPDFRSSELPRAGIVGTSSPNSSRLLANQKSVTLLQFYGKEVLMRDLDSKQPKSSKLHGHWRLDSHHQMTPKVQGHQRPRPNGLSISNCCFGSITLLARIISHQCLSRGLKSLTFCSSRFGASHRPITSVKINSCSGGGWIFPALFLNTTENLPPHLKIVPNRGSRTQCLLCSSPPPARILHVECAVEGARFFGFWQIFSQLEANQISVSFGFQTPFREAKCKV